MTRRASLTTLTGGAAAAALIGKGVAQTAGSEVKPDAGENSFQHSICYHCYRGIPLEELCVEVKKIGVTSVELLPASDWKTLQKHGMTCAMGTVQDKGGIGKISKGFNRTEHHDTLYAIYDEAIEQAAAAGNVPQLICFSGDRDGMDDDEGLKNCAIGLKRIMPLAEKHGITLSMELLNSKRNHPDHMCDHTEWGAALVDAVGSDRFKLLYDIYHMQIMEGDCIATFTKHWDRISHYHTAGVPGRHEIGDTQELNYRGICNALAKNGYSGFLGQEFKPLNDPYTSLREAIEICSV